MTGDSDMTHKTLKAAIATALALTTLSSATLQAGNNRVLLQSATSNVQMSAAINRRALPIEMIFDCVVDGTPVEFPDDIAISHNYNFTTPAGTRVAWTAPFGNFGRVALPALEPGKRYIVRHAVPGGITAGSPCTAVQD